MIAARAIAASPDPTPRRAAACAASGAAVVGVGCSRGCPADELAALVDAALADARVPAADVTALATIDLKANEPAILALARHWGWRLALHPAAALADTPVPTPSATVARHVGTPSVAEAAALRTSGGALVVPKRTSPHATCAIAIGAA